MLMLGSLILYSNDVFASQKSYRIGNSEVTARVDDGFERLVNKEYKPHFEKYVTKQSVVAEISYKGVSARTAIPVTIEKSVSKKVVFANLLARARIGGSILAGRAAGLMGGPVGWAATIALTAYELSSPPASTEKYYYDEKYKDFVKEQVNVYCVATSGRCTDQNKKETVMNPRAVYADMDVNPSDEEINQKLCSQLDYQHFGASGIYKKKSTRFNRSNARCVVVFEVVQNSGYLIVGQEIERESSFLEFVPKVKEPISQAKFDQYVQPLADASPNRYVGATANQDGTVPGEQESPDVSVASGTVVQLGPFTDTDGQAKQVTLTFGRDAQGRTTVSVKETPRPDLKPKSSEAPVPEKKPRTEIIPNPNPDKKPDKDSDKDKDKDGKEKPDPDGKPSDKEKPEPNGKPDGGDKPKPDDKPKTGLLCEMFPKILACAEMGDVEENEPFQVPNIKDETTFSPDNFLPSNGICPAPKTVNILGNSYKVSYDLLCRFAEMSRFLILAIAAVLAARIMFGSQKKD